MKKRTRKLGLNLETVRHLESYENGTVVGQFATSAECFIPTGCDCATNAPDCTLPPSACLGTCSC